MAALALSSCNTEESLEPSYKDKDWYTIEDNPGDELQHQRHLLYKDYGISMFFTDTLGFTERYNHIGEKVKYYQILRVGYLLNDASNSLYSFSFLPEPSETHTERLIMASVLKSEVIEQLPEECLLKKILVINSFTVDPYTLRWIKQPVYAYVAGDVLLVGNLPAMPEQMTASHKQRAINKIKAALLAHFILNSEDEQISTLREDFFYVTNNVNVDPLTPYDFYGKAVPYAVWNRNGHPDDPWHYGLLYTRASELDVDEWVTIWKPSTWSYERIFITAEADLTDYIVLYFEKTQAEVETQYASYDAIKTKFGIISDLIDAVL